MPYCIHVLDGTNRPALTDSDIAFALFVTACEVALAPVVSPSTSPAARRALYTVGARRPARRPAAEVRAERAAAAWGFTR